jgi:hypothetical protein
MYIGRDCSLLMYAALRTGIHVASLTIKIGSMFRIGGAREGVIGFDFRSEDQGTAWQSDDICILARSSTGIT